MKFFSKTLAITLSGTAALLAGGAAQAQVAGIGSTTRVAVISRSQAVIAGYQQIETANSASLDTMDQRNKEITELSKILDLDKDGQFSEQEQAAAQNELAKVQQSMDTNKDGKLTGTEATAFRARNLPIQQIIDKNNEIATLREPIYAAQVFVIDNVNKQYDAALKQVVTSKKINVVLSPTAFQYAPPEIDITAQVATALDRLVPSVGTTPPAEYRVSEATLALHEQVGRVLMTRAAIAAQQAQAAAQGQQPAGQPTPAQPAPAPGQQPDSR